jgi:predicted RNA methylase
MQSVRRTTLAFALDRIKRLVSLGANGPLDYFRYLFWVRAKRLDFGPASLETLGLSPNRSVHHSASGGILLAEVCKRIEIPPGSRILDLGSGKGAAVCTLARFPFDEILGCELSESLVRIAAANTRKLGLENVHFVVSDASKFTDLDRFTHVYMFNPFPALVMKEVMMNVAASLIRKPRWVTLIYLYPVCGDVVMGCGLFTRRAEIHFPSSHPFHVYHHEHGRP